MRPPGRAGLLTVLLLLLIAGVAPEAPGTGGEWATEAVARTFVVRVGTYLLPAPRHALLAAAFADGPCRLRTDVGAAPSSSGGGEWGSCAPFALHSPRRGWYHHPRKHSRASPAAPCSWAVRRRANVAWALPSDFDVVVLDGPPAVVSTALASLRRWPAVLSATPEMRVTRALRGFDPEERRQHGRKTTAWDVPANASHHERVGRGLKAKARAGPAGGVSAALNAPHLWRHGYSGAGVRVGVFDTGLRAGHRHFRRVVERTDWTDEETLEDGVGHGSFVAGVIASSKECLGFAPNAELHIFRVFTNKQVSYTSWFLDAFNYAIHTGMQVVNLSIGGPDFRDLPFVAKVNELTASGCMLVSAIGNDGPVFGTLNNPADQNNVIGVGGITYADQVASFSSRGMSLWELPHGYGRIKPDVVTYGAGVRGSSVGTGCRSLSGTSVASPVVAGAVTLLASVVAPRDRPRLVNPASMKQALVETASRLPGFNVFVQGQGKLNLTAAAALLLAYTPRASIVPRVVDTTEAACPFLWPFCSQPLYPTGQPLIVNLTVLNGMGVTGFVEEAAWRPSPEGHGRLLDVAITHCGVVWPWAGWLALRIAVNADAAPPRFEGVAEGLVTFAVRTPAGERSEVRLAVRVRVAPQPARQRRILWDQFHSLAYPSGYFPRDNLEYKADPLDWHGDHPHTNFRKVYRFLRRAGYFVEVLGSPLTCFDASHYGTLLIVDPEEEFFDAELDKLERDVRHRGLSVMVFADWYSVPVMTSVKFFDENTNNLWYPETGGANVPALNELLGRWGIALSDHVFDGEFTFGGKPIQYESGSSIARFPPGGLLISAVLRNSTQQAVHRPENAARVPILGLVQVQEAGDVRRPRDELRHAELRAPGRRQVLGVDELPALQRSGRVVVYGDSNCLDESRQHGAERCTGLLEPLLHYSMHGSLAPSLVSIADRVEEAGPLPGPLPRAAQSTLFLYSSVLNGSNTRKLPAPACPALAWAHGRDLGQGAFQRFMADVRAGDARWQGDLDPDEGNGADDGPPRRIPGGHHGVGDGGRGWRPDRGGLRPDVLLQVLAGLLVLVALVCWRFRRWARRCSKRRLLAASAV